MVVVPCTLGLSPVSAALRLCSEPGFAWLDGGLTHGREGRFSFLAASPVAVVERRFGAPDPLDALASLLPEADEPHSPSARSDDVDIAQEDVPRWIGHISYDAAYSGELQGRLPRNRAIPCLRFARYAALFAYDHERERGFIVGDDRAACLTLARKLERAEAKASEHSFETGLVGAELASTHEQRIRSALNRIVEGDVYEVNLARHYQCAFSGSALGLFLRMRELSPVPFGYFVEASDHAVLGRSMERFLRFRSRDRALWTSPIKGTVAQGSDRASEAEQLRSDPKEHAEHAMVVDLMRNDLSRVSAVGSVVVRDLMEVLPFAGLAHLVSTVEARALPQLSLTDILRGTFPPGSVTGAPKRSAMQIIEALEAHARGIYTGAVGFIDRTGGFSFAVAIRTAVVHGGQAEYFAGGGIVIKSDAGRETLETDLKAQVFLKALQASASGSLPQTPK